MKVIKVIHKIATWFVLTVGVIHVLGTFFFYDDLSEAAVWFAGAGLGGIFAAFLNMGLFQRGSLSVTRRLTGVANVLFLVWLAVGFAATPALPPGVILALGGTMAVSGIALVASATWKETCDNAT